ncbi:Transcriptional regulator, LysR family [hydrothermal vent metagenome]|uniref:Transcriptional regulator, LysR family n=1 Tax=hydrothermal vent metagenome TaxID=652676 RepID=A0A3B0YPS1_9ZZZZ
MDKLRSMAVFVQIAEHGSLTAAANMLGLSLPSVVRILASLEHSMQVRLFNRTTRRVTLTQEGEFYLQQCRKILADIDETERALGQKQSEPSGNITITAPVRFGEMHVAPAVADFLKQYPKTRVKLLLLDRVVDLLEEGIDVAVRIAHLADSSLIARPMGVIRQIVCASPDLLNKTGMPDHPEALSDLPCVCFTGIAPASIWQFQDKGKYLAVPVTGKLVCNQVKASADACVAGVGFGLFYCYQVTPHIQSGQLVPVLTNFEPEPVPLSLVYPHVRLLSARVRAIVDWLTDNVGWPVVGNKAMLHPSS